MEKKKKPKSGEDVVWSLPLSSLYDDLEKTSLLLCENRALHSLHFINTFWMIGYFYRRMPGSQVSKDL